MGHRGQSAPFLLFLLFFLGLSASTLGRIVKVPAGPLVRVEGTEVRIPCNVTQYDGPSEQNFDWEFSRNPSQDSKFVNVVSTWDPSFMSQEYRDRVTRGDIMLRRNSNNAVELVIGSIRPTDQGVYRCTTPSTDSVFHGNYNAAVEVKVIADGLTVTGSKARSASAWNLSEGDSFQLHCSASTNSSEHTHLHVSWEFKNGLVWQEILSLTHEGKFQPGPDYNERYISGYVRLDAMANDIYRLSVSQALPSDEGAYRCRVSEWVKDADGSWQKIQEKSVDVASVVVQPTALGVFITRTNVSVTERDSLYLTCNFTTDRSGIFQAEVTWYYSESPDGPMEDAQILLSADRDSVISDSTLISLSHVDRSSYHLLVRDMSIEDSGYYFCQAALWVPQYNGSWHKVAERTSVPVTVEVTPLEPNYHVFLNASKMPKYSEDPTELECRITEVQNTEANVRYTVSWYYRLPLRSDEVVKDELLATMDADWMLAVGERSKQRAQNGEIIFSKPAVNTFRLRIQWTSEADKGEYYCIISSWSRQRNNSWIKIKDVASMPVSILWSTQGPVFNASVHSDNPTVYRDELVNLLCIITIEGTVLNPDDMSFDVSWFAVRSYAMDRPPVFLASLDRKGIAIQARRNGSSDVSLAKIAPLEFQLRIHGCEDQDFGNHYCVVIPWVRSAAGVWQQEMEVKSKPIFVTVKMDVLNAFKFPLLIGIGLATLIGLLSCLIGYCSSRWCCKKEVQETRRERRRLMSMEMD
ncbi:prostaglandin F2 receptor negative regulator-like isoform X2 [Heteronotia binoei]|uniref:prostaglandin F2 receptor negative regulator-like isoform X2 n=1 Tax=Heteronotia binoei TaxID=13085 RepID=UPI00292FB82A|nr:prostaglandin F2 receptor negative regulator-like isoform X2 [Heteronotia binoei]